MIIFSLINCQYDVIIFSLINCRYDVIIFSLMNCQYDVIIFSLINCQYEMNRRHKAAQYAQRASVSMHTLLFFRHKPAQETAYVLAVSPSSLTVLVCNTTAGAAVQYESCHNFTGTFLNFLLGTSVWY